jgi:hypothetical protein
LLRADGKYIKRFNTWELRFNTLIPNIQATMKIIWKIKRGFVQVFSMLRFFKRVSCTQQCDRIQILAQTYPVNNSQWISMFLILHQYWPYYISELFSWLQYIMHFLRKKIASSFICFCSFIVRFSYKHCVITD